MPVNVQPKRQPRPREQVAAMALVAQVNALQLLLAAHKRGLTEAPRLASPGVVREFREALIDWRTIKEYSDGDLMLRTHQVWGQYCLFCWAFYGLDPHDPPAYGGLAPEQQMRCGRQLAAKLDRIVLEMKALRAESDRRGGRSSDHAPLAELHAAARALPVVPARASGRKPSPGMDEALQKVADSELLERTCVYAGMLAAGRWMADTVWRWEDPEIMNPDAPGS
jgi:hypothetical protein